jgi:lipopolysaccharide biosynthesis protein
MTRIIAFYLPQFHPIPENDEWWGEGFTEWTNVRKAKPLFKGHYQPRIPADLGYYDLRMPEIREAQAKLARSAGVEGFMYWHYWFGNGKMLLERPFKEVLESKQPDFPFCLGWANHSWTNRMWNPSAQNTKEFRMIEQTYPGESDSINHFNYLLKAFIDKRYIKVHGKPLLYIYNPLHIPAISGLLKLWNKMAIDNNLNGIYFVARGNEDETKKLLEAGFNAVNPNIQWNAESKVKGKYLRLLHRKIAENFRGIILDKYKYSEIIKHLIPKDIEENHVYPTIIPQWDRTPRSGKRTTLYYGSTPELFGSHVESIIKKISNKPKEDSIIFLKSWNEWAEGNYIEPDIKFGLGYLNALKSNI